MYIGAEVKKTDNERVKYRKKEKDRIYNNDKKCMYRKMIMFNNIKCSLNNRSKNIDTKQSNKRNYQDIL